LRSYFFGLTFLFDRRSYFWVPTFLVVSHYLLVLLNVGIDWLIHGRELRKFSDCFLVRLVVY
jgi:hypothetical protein